MLAAPDDPNELPIPMGVRIDTGAVCPPLTAADADRILAGATPSALAIARANGQTDLGHDSSVANPNNLSQTGWAILFSSDADPAIKQQLKPLLDLRQRQVLRRAIPGRLPLFRIFEGDEPNTGGVLLNPDGTPQTALQWTHQHGASLTSPVVPSIVPYYVLIVGSPERIPFSFQQDLKSQWLVGRLYFDDIEDYGRYAAHVVAQEPDPATPDVDPPVPPTQAARLDHQQPRRRRDHGARQRAHRQLPGHRRPGAVDPRQRLGLCPPICLCAPTRPRPGSGTFSAALAARSPCSSPARTARRRRRPSPTTMPPTSAAPRERSSPRRGCPGSAVTDDCFFRADDIPDTNILPGMMVFLFACFSAELPRHRQLPRQRGRRSPIAVAKAPFISKLAQALLSHGALAVIGHIDRAYKYGFVDTSGTSQVQAFRTPLEVLMQGQQRRSRRRLLQLDRRTRCRSPSKGQAGLSPRLPLVRMHIACDDARNYIVLGDPATRLRVPSAE